MYSIIGLKPQKSFTDSWLTPIAELNFLITLLAHLDEPKVSITNRRDSWKHTNKATKPQVQTWACGFPYLKGTAEYTYDTLGNLVLDTSKNKSVDYE